MKILFATDTYFPASNGTTTLLYHLSGKLVGQGHEVHILAPGVSIGGESYVQDNGAIVHGVPTIPIPLYPDFRLPVLPVLKRVVRKHFNNIEPDVVHIHHHFIIGKAVFEVAKERDLPIMGTNHFMPDNLIHYFPIPGFLVDRVRIFMWSKMFAVYENLDLVTTPTTIAVDVLKKVGFKKEVIPLSNGINLERFSGKIDGGKMRKKYRLANKKVLIFVGRLDEEKRIDLLFKALPAVAKKVDIQLLVVGKGILRKKLGAMVRELNLGDKVTFSGYVSDKDLPEVYKAADAFVMPGDAELQSIATLEAMASGLPVIVANAVALPMLVKNGKNGYLFKSGDISDLSHKIIKVFSDNKLRARMTRESLMMAKSHDLGKVSLLYESFYKKLVANRTREEKVAGSYQEANKFLVPALVTVGLVMIMVVAYAFGGPTTIHAESAKIIAKINPKVLATRSVSTIKNGVSRVETTVKENIASF
ncbi:MAG: glycosyltransferase [Candidatus Curtissbacteria bacterium]|nr:glycosyltransferase [Candidatus Curtissbacteria bacterium]